MKLVVMFQVIVQLMLKKTPKFNLLQSIRQPPVSLLQLILLLMELKHNRLQLILPMLRILLPPILLKKPCLPLMVPQAQLIQSQTPLKKVYKFLAALKRLPIPALELPSPALIVLPQLTLLNEPDRKLTRVYDNNSDHKCEMERKNICKSKSIKSKTLINV
jgi:hypothetical protein